MMSALLLSGIAGELLTRIELVTSSLPRKCSTTELQQHGHCSLLSFGFSSGERKTGLKPATPSLEG